MISKSDLLRELARRTEAAKARGDQAAVELYARTYHRVNEEPAELLPIAGLRARRAAADVAGIPLQDRIIGSGDGLDEFRRLEDERAALGLPAPGDSPGEHTDAAIAAYRRDRGAGR